VFTKLEYLILNHHTRVIRTGATDRCHAYHWWTGIGNIIEAVLIGVLLMLFYRRSAALWPVVLGHYLTDIVDFAL
jgi:hypothetical protein